MLNMLKNRDILSILDLSRDEIKIIFNEANEMLKHKNNKISILKGKILATAFFEPSTRTRLSFQTAMLRLGGDVIDLSLSQISSISKGENIADTIHMLDSYADIIVIRHKLEGVARYAAEIASSPVINGGDGTKDHPTQALIDLYTIMKNFNAIDGLSIGVLGDLKYGRAARSFILGVSKYDIDKLYLISPPELRARLEVLNYLKERKVNFKEVVNIKDVIGNLDVLYVTRIQKERFPDIFEYERVKGSYRITLKLLKNSKKNLIILHPLPRIDEIDFSVDATSYAKYFEQASYGIPIRMALLKLILVGRDE